MLVNLFDSNFTGQSCSVAYQESEHVDYVHRLMTFDGATMFTDEWINSPIVDDVQSKYKFGWLHEPYCLHPQTYERTLVNRHKFDFIFTYYQPLLDEYPDKLRFCPYGGTWLDSLDWGIKPKTKLCSMLIGAKASTEGHLIRHEAAVMIQEAGYPVDFYGIIGQPTDYSQETKLTVLENYCFSIVTETCRDDNLFTEHTLDCFAVGTIPIYYGAPNIHKFFDTGGIFQFDTVYRLQKTLAGLSTASWASRLPHIYANLVKMQDYAITEDWMFKNVLKDLE